MSFLAPRLGDEVMLRRLCILLVLMAAYIKAIMQLIGFNSSKLEFNILSKEMCSGDGQPLSCTSGGEHTMGPVHHIHMTSCCSTYYIP